MATPSSGNTNAPRDSNRPKAIAARNSALSAETLVWYSEASAWVHRFQRVVQSPGCGGSTAVSGICCRLYEAYGVYSLRLPWVLPTAKCFRHIRGGIATNTTFPAFRFCEKCRRPQKATFGIHHSASDGYHTRQTMAVVFDCEIHWQAAC